MANGGQDTGQLLDLIMPSPKILLQSSEHAVQEDRVRIRRHREAMVVVRDRKRSVLVLNRQLAVFEDLAILVAEGGYHELHVLRWLSARRPPVDIVKAGVD